MTARKIRPVARLLGADHLLRDILVSKEALGDYALVIGRLGSAVAWRSHADLQAVHHLAANHGLQRSGRCPKTRLTALGTIDATDTNANRPAVGLQVKGVTDVAMDCPQE